MTQPSPINQAEIRDCSANVRTFLAYKRTGFAFLLGGLTIAHFIYLLHGNSSFVYTGALFLLVEGSILPMFGAWQYSAVDKAIGSQYPYPNRRILKLAHYSSGGVFLFVGANFAVYALDPTKIMQAFGH